MTPVSFHPAAEQEFRDAAEYYERARAGLGDDFEAEVAAALIRIRRHPKMYAAESGAIRICPLHRFPYSLFYEVLSDRIWIAAVGHHARRPDFWAGRRPD